MGRVGRAAACLDSTQKTSEEWCENRCDKRGWTSTQTSVVKGRKSVTSCRETASLLFRYTPLHSAGEKLELIIAKSDRGEKEVKEGELCPLI